jgi:LacI family transcriptional regulator
MKSKPLKPSVKDVALLAGVSLGSVSRTLNGVSNVSPEIRDKVMQAVTTLDYRLNHTARSLRSRSSHTVGCMLTDVTNPLYARLYRVFEERLRNAGYMVMLANSLNRLDWELDILSMFHSRGMDGVIIAPGFERNARVLAAIDQLGIPAVVLDRDTSAQQDHVLFDHARGVKAAVQHLLGLGHRRIALLVGTSANRPMRRRIEGWRAGLATHGIKADPRWLVRLSYATAPAADAVRQLLDLPAPPTAIITLGTSALADVLNTAHAAGLQVPRDLSVVSMGDPDFARGYQPAISTVVVDIAAAAEQSCQMLLQRMRGQTREAPRCVLLPTEFVDRGSCGPAPALPT